MEKSLNTSCLHAVRQVFKLAHQHISTSAHQHINTSTHQHINTSTHQHIRTSTNQHINKSTDQQISMRKSQTQKIGDVIRDCLNELRIARKLKEVSIVSEWESLMGKTVANRTEKIYIKNRTLFVHVRSSVLKTELIMMRQDIMSRINENAGETLIDLIVIK